MSNTWTTVRNADNTTSLIREGLGEIIIDVKNRQVTALNKTIGYRDTITYKGKRDYEKSVLLAYQLLSVMV